MIFVKVSYNNYMRLILYIDEWLNITKGECILIKQKVADSFNQQPHLFKMSLKCPSDISK